VLYRWNNPQKRQARQFRKQIKVDETLIKKAISRDSGAIEALYDTYAPKLLTICFRYSGNREDAEDILHDGFIKIIQNIHTFKIKTTGTFEAWMKRIMVNTALNMLRARIKEQKNVDIDPLIDMLNFSDQDDADHDASYHLIDQDQILTWICDLPIGYRTVFNMYVFEQYGHREIAELLGISENTSKSQLLKARGLLRKKLNQMVNTEMIPTYEK
jgi:RNA polymerase sigma-70 factor (ECF subfamily)